MLIRIRKRYVEWVGRGECKTTKGKRTTIKDEMYDVYAGWEW